MDRRLFLKQFGIAGIGLPVFSGQTINLSAKAIKIYDNYLRGLDYYAYPSFERIIKQGNEITLLHESENIHDSFAVAAYFKNKMIGYLPAYENIVIANLLDAGVKLSCFVSKHRLLEGYYHRLSVEIFTELVVDNLPVIQKLPKRADDFVDKYRGGMRY